MEANVRCIDFFSNISSFMFLFLKYLLFRFFPRAISRANYLCSWKGFLLFGVGCLLLELCQSTQTNGGERHCDIKLRSGLPTVVKAFIKQLNGHQRIIINRLHDMILLKLSPSLDSFASLVFPSFRLLGHKAKAEDERATSIFHSLSWAIFGSNQKI